MARKDLAALLAQVQKDLAAVKKGGAKQVEKIVEDAVALAEERERSRKVLAAVEAAEMAQRERYRAVPMPSSYGRGLRAKSGEALPEFATVADHRVNRGEMSRADIVSACQDTKVKDRDGSVPSDDTLMKRLDNLEAKRARRAVARG